MATASVSTVLHYIILIYLKKKDKQKKDRQNEKKQAGLGDFVITSWLLLLLLNRPYIIFRFSHTSGWNLL